ncbi:MAG: hypothetical protein M1836_005060 [Candelina mexicana]|nr:MAG: hypothetical protein M1836_005060 [Candelina mexicana]
MDHPNPFAAPLQWFEDVFKSHESLKSTTKLIVVVGATGGQGGSVVSRFLNDTSYRVRGVTRNVESQEAKVLTSQGVEMVKADLNDYESVIRAFAGAAVIFAVTNFFEPSMKQGWEVAMEIEFDMGFNMAKAASNTPTLEHYIWSTLPNPRKISGGTMTVPHFEAAYQIDNYIKQDVVLFPKTTFLWCAYYASNLQLPLSTPNYLKSLGKYVWMQPTTPSTKIVCIGSHRDNIGVFVHAIIKQPYLTLPGKYVLAHYETLTAEQLLSLWSVVTGKQAEYVEVSREDFERLWPHGGKEMGLMLRFWEEAGGLSWSGEGLVTGDRLLAKEHLGLTKRDLVGVKEAFEQMDWSGI